MPIKTVIATYGSDEWRDLAYSRAYPSVAHAGGVGEQGRTCVVIHGPTLAVARNAGADDADDWILFLDADDEIDAGYLAAMDAAIEREGGDTRAMFTPSVQYIHGRKEYRPRFNPEVPIERGNWLVIGTVLHRDAFFEVGGFEEWPLYEDWALFARMQKAGCRVVRVPGAVYRAHRSQGSRNHPSHAEKVAAHVAIHAAVFGATS